MSRMAVRAHSKEAELKDWRKPCNSSMASEQNAQYFFGLESLNDLTMKQASPLFYWPIWRVCTKVME